MDLKTIPLAYGSHETRDDGMCAMEAVAWLAGEPHSDHPACASDVISIFLRQWNDDLPNDEMRNVLLRPLIPALLGTATTAEDELTRSYLAVDWVVRDYAPSWLALVPGLESHAKALADCGELMDAPSTAAARTLAEAAWAAALTTRTAALTAAEAAEAAEEAALTAAEAAEAAALTAALTAADAAEATEAAVEAVAEAVAEAAALTAAEATESAVEAGEAALRPTVERLQRSAQELVLRMCEVGRGSDAGKHTSTRI